MMEADRAVLCGPKGRHQVERPAWRGGSVESPVTLGGRQVEVPRLRVRSADGEVPLVSFQWAAATDRWTSTRWPRSPPGCRRAGTRGTLDPVPQFRGGSWRCRRSASRTRRYGSSGPPRCWRGRAPGSATSTFSRRPRPVAPPRRWVRT